MMKAQEWAECIKKKTREYKICFNFETKDRHIIKKLNWIKRKNLFVQFFCKSGKKYGIILAVIERFAYT